jgi:hypothetical protein
MIRYFTIAVLTLCVLAATNLQAQQKLAQTGFQFLSVGVDARATALGSAMSTIEGTSSSLFHNPAGIAGMTTTFDISVNQHTWIADIQYLSGSIGLNLSDGRYGTFGLSYLVLDYGEFIGTRVALSGEDDYIETGTFSPSALAVGIGYGIKLSEAFSVGGQIKYAYQDLGSSVEPVQWLPGVPPDQLESTDREYSKGVVAFDFGTRYATGYRSLVFGMSVRNFSQEIKYARESFQLPLTFTFGVAMNVLDFFPAISSTHKLNVSVDASHPRASAEHVSFGAEYVFMDFLSLRGGYSTDHINDAEGMALGVGLRQFGLGVDYSYTPFAVFDDIHRISIHFGM